MLRDAIPRRDALRAYAAGPLRLDVYRRGEGQRRDAAKWAFTPALPLWPGGIQFRSPPEVSWVACVCVCKTANGRYPLVRTSPRLASAAAAAARTRRRRSLARRLATRLAADVRCARPTVRSVACAALRAALRALLRLHCLSLLLLVVVMVLLLVQMLLLERRGSATGLDARVGSI